MHNSLLFVRHNNGSRLYMRALLVVYPVSPISCCFLLKRRSAFTLHVAVTSLLARPKKKKCLWFRFPNDPVNLCATQIIL